MKNISKKTITILFISLLLTITILAILFITLFLKKSNSYEVTFDDNLATFNLEKLINEFDDKFKGYDIMESSVFTDASSMMIYTNSEEKILDIFIHLRLYNEKS